MTYHIWQAGLELGRPRWAFEWLILGRGAYAYHITHLSAVSHECRINVERLWRVSRVASADDVVLAAETASYKAIVT